jgi:cytochrome bd ubiquinol oxidase subunit I
MDTALATHRLHFAFTITYHYLFPMLTMGLAMLIFVLKTMYRRSGDEHYNRSARFWGKIFGINFLMGVVTGIPMEFQFGTNWSEFSRMSGGVVGQTLAMEGTFAFFLESAFLGIFLYGEKRVGQFWHWVSSLAVFVGAWLSGYFIVATNAWMQNPVGHVVREDGTFALASFWDLILNEWALIAYPHVILGSVITASAVMCAVGAFYLMSRRDEAYARTFLKLGVISGLASSILVAFPSGDYQAKLVAEKQPVTFAAIEGLFETVRNAPLVIIGQPDVEARKLDNAIEVPGVLSFLTYNRFGEEVKGLNEFPQEDWPQNIPLLYYTYRFMVGLGTIFILVFAIAAFLLWRGKLYTAPAIQWALLLMFPFTYIANIAGWYTAELGRQPWVIYGLMRTEVGASPTVSAGNAMFTLLGFMGIYAVLSILFLLLIRREIDHGPDAVHSLHPAAIDESPAAGAAH